MKKLSKIIIIIIAIILTLIIFTFIFKNQITGSTIQDFNDSYTYTKAICNNSNYCIESEITCENNSVVNVKPLTKDAQFSENWTDPRPKDQEQLC